MKKGMIKVYQPNILFFNKTVVQYLVTYLILVTIVILLLSPIGVIAYKNSLEIFEKEQTQRVLEGFTEVLTALEQCKTYAYNMASNNNIMRISNSESGDSGLALYMYNLTLYQNSNLWNNPLVKDVIIQFARNDTLITHTNIYHDKKVFYERFFEYEGVSYSKWQENLFSDMIGMNKDVVVYTLTGKKENIIALNYYYYNLTEPQLVISFIIPEHEILSRLMTNEIRDYGNIKLSFGNEKSPVTIEYNSDHVLTRMSRELLTLNSYDSNISLQSSLSHDAFSRNLAPVFKVLIIYMLIALITGVMLSVVFTKLNMRPLKAITNFISQLGIGNTEYRGNAYAYIQQALTGVTHSEESMKEAYELVFNSLEHIVFSMVVKGLPVDTEQINSALGHIHILGGSYVLVGVIYEPDPNMDKSELNPDIAMIEAKRLFIEKMENPYLFEYDILYAVLDVKLQEDIVSLQSLLEEMQSGLFDTLKVKMRFGVSEVVSRPECLGIAAEQVHYTLKIIRYKDMPSVMFYSKDTLSIPSSVHIDEEILAKLLVQDNESSLRAYFVKMQNNLYSKSPVSPLMCKTLYYSVLAVFQKVMDNISLDHSITLKEYDDRIGVRNNMSYLFDTGLKINNTLCKQNCEQISNVSKDILKYINDNFASATLNLALVADHFSLSERYVSALIKEQSGLNYSDYVEEIRMKEARRLLNHTNAPINTIGESVGYDRTNSFYKSFKRYTGLSPRQYREKFCE